MNSLSGERRAIVTGAASGIGLAVARRLRREGAKVLAVDINKHGLAEAAATGCETMTADLAKPGERDGLAKAADGIDYLVNAAGIIRLKSIFEFTVEDWREILTINAESTFFLCQAIGPRMRPSKSAILSITRSFAYALASRPVRVNAICPGIIDTPMQERVLEDVAKLRATTSHALSEGRNKMVPLGRSASADECAGAIWFLLSDEASYMTGQAMNFTGGLVQW
jgi:NAD(P)-dependent dehydrogenase (short-subunit alcohol dehydrogenase family)